MSADQKFDQLMTDAKESRDPYRTLAAHVLSKSFANVSPEDRHRFKQAFYVMFHLRGPDLIRGMMEDLRELDNLPEVREWLRQKARNSG